MTEMPFKQHAKSWKVLKIAQIGMIIMRLCFSKVKARMNSLSSLNIEIMLNLKQTFFFFSSFYCEISMFYTVA